MEVAEVIEVAEVVEITGVTELAGVFFFFSARRWRPVEVVAPGKDSAAVTSTVSAGARWLARSPP